MNWSMNHRATLSQDLRQRNSGQLTVLAQAFITGMPNVQYLCHMALHV